MDKTDKSDWLIDSLYSSKLFEKLSDKETGLYREGAAYVYQYFLEENQ